MEQKAEKGEKWFKLSNEERQLVARELRVLRAAGGNGEWNQFLKILDQVAGK